MRRPYPQVGRCRNAVAERSRTTSEDWPTACRRTGGRIFRVDALRRRRPVKLIGLGRGRPPTTASGCVVARSRRHRRGRLIAPGTRERVGHHQPGIGGGATSSFRCRSLPGRPSSGAHPGRQPGRRRAKRQPRAVVRNSFNLCAGGLIGLVAKAGSLEGRSPRYNVTASRSGWRSARHPPYGPSSFRRSYQVWRKPWVAQVQPRCNHSNPKASWCRVCDVGGPANCNQHPGVPPPHVTGARARGSVGDLAANDAASTNASGSPSRQPGRVISAQQRFQGHVSGPERPVLADH